MQKMRQARQTTGMAETNTINEVKKASQMNKLMTASGRTTKKTPSCSTTIYSKKRLSRHIRFKKQKVG